MKINLTHSETIEAIRRHFNFPGNAEIIIGKKPKQEKPSVPVIQRVSRTGHVVPRFLYDQRSLSGENVFDEITLHLHNNKIGAIKAVRSASGYGLKEAKDAVENWDAFYKVMLEKDRWPDISFEFGMPVFL